MIIQANAKLNWTLDITGKRADGYHLLDMLTSPLALHDVISIEKTDTLSLSVSGNDQVPVGSDNLVLKAVNALSAYTRIAFPVKIVLEKHIPSGAGLGGGSADAAAVLKALNLLYELHLDEQTLCDIGIRLGADLPVCILNRPARVQGIGEHVMPISIPSGAEMLLIKPCEGLSTRDVFRLADSTLPCHPDTENAMQTLLRGAYDQLSQFGGNALLDAATNMRPEIPAAMECLKTSGAVYTMMTGSGAVVYGVYPSAELADQAAESLRAFSCTDFIRTKTI